MTSGAMTDDGKTLTLSLLGHATGSPEVCAGISAIAGALAGWVLNHPGAEPATIRLEEGEAYIRVVRPDLRCRVAFEMAEIGLLQIARQYPEFLKFQK